MLVIGRETVQEDGYGLWVTLTYAADDHGVQWEQAHLIRLHPVGVVESVTLDKVERYEPKAPRGV